jgi:hypothetical protein
MHLPKRAGPALAGQRSHLGALAFTAQGPSIFETGWPGALPACGRGILRMRKDGSFRHRPKQFKSTHFASADGQKQFEKSTAYHLNVRAVEGS